MLAIQFVNENTREYICDHGDRQMYFRQDRKRTIYNEKILVN